MRGIADTDDLTGLNRRLQGWLVLLGLIAGLVLAWRYFDKAAIYQSLFLGFFLCLVLSTVVWFAGLLLLARFKNPGSTFSKCHLAQYRISLKERWPYLILAAILGLGSVLCHMQMRNAQDELVSFFRQNQQPQGSGWRSFLYHSYGEFSTLPHSSWIADSVDYSQANHRHFGGNRFFSRFIGLVNLEQAQELELGLISDDGALLLVDGIRVVDNLGFHPAIQKTSRVQLDPGWHSLEILHYQAIGEAAIKFLGPAGFQGKIKPLVAGVDSYRLHHLTRAVEIHLKRTWALTGLALALFLFCLLPAPHNWQNLVKNWLYEHWPHLLMIGGLAGLMSWGLGYNPSSDGDTEQYFRTAVDWYYKGEIYHRWSNYIEQDLLIWPAFILQQLFYFTIGSLRAFAMAISLGGLLLLSLAVEKVFDRRASLFTLLILGTSAVFFFYGREYLSYTFNWWLGVGGAFFGLAYGQRWWGPLICSLSLSLGLYSQNLFAVFVLSFGFMIAVGLGPRVLLKWRFWLGAAAFALLAQDFILGYLGGAIDHPAGQTGLEMVAGRVYEMLSRYLPEALSGESIAQYWAGRVMYPILPLAPLMVAAGLVSFWKLDMPRSYRRPILTLALGSLFLFLLTCYKISIPTPRYCLLSSICLLVWLSLYLAVLSRKKGNWGKAALVLAGLVAASNLYVYTVDMQYAWLESGGGMYNPQRGMVQFTSQRTMDKRAVYAAMTKHKDRFVLYEERWARRTFKMLETEEIHGRRGVLNTDHSTYSGSIHLMFRHRDYLPVFPQGALVVPMGKRAERNHQAFIYP
jgi:hypothetical protein